PSAGSDGGGFTLEPSAGGNLWRNYTYSFTATSSATDIAFTGVQGIFYIGLDNASVTVEPVTQVARCKHVTVSADVSCRADASIDDGSFSPNAGDAITLVQSPPGPYPPGETSVTLT